MGGVGVGVPGVGAAAVAAGGIGVVPGPGLFQQFLDLSQNLSQQIARNRFAVGALGFALMTTRTVPVNLVGFTVMLTGLSPLPLTTFAVMSTLATVVYVG